MHTVYRSKLATQFPSCGYSAFTSVYSSKYLPLDEVESFHEFHEEVKPAELALAIAKGEVIYVGDNYGALVYDHTEAYRKTLAAKKEK